MVIGRAVIARKGNAVRRGIVRAVTVRRANALAVIAARAVTAAIAAR
jgi:hypothetical protein